MNESNLGNLCRPTSKSDAAAELAGDDLPTLMRKAKEMERNLRGKGQNTGVPEVASGGSYL